MNPDRRKFLRLAGAGSAAVVLSAAPGTSWASPTADPGTAQIRTCVLVVDGCRPDEITPDLTPRLAALRAEGTNFPAARSLPVMETIPNHVMMMTGVRPDRSGVPANSVFDPARGSTGHGPRNRPPLSHAAGTPARIPVSPPPPC